RRGARAPPRPRGLPADPRRTPVGDVEQGPIPAGIKSVGANAGLDETSLLERVAVDHVDAAASELGHVEHLAVGADPDVLRNATARQLEVAEHLAIDPVDLHQLPLVLTRHDQVSAVDREVAVVDAGALGS